MIGDLIITSLETITAFDVTTGAYKFTLDELQNATISQGEESNDITGKGGRKLSTLKRNKTATISGTNGMVSSGLLALQTGGTLTTKNTKVMWTDYLTVNASHKASTSWVGVGTQDAEIKGLHVKNADGTLNTSLTQVAVGTTLSTGKFTYKADTKELTFHTDVAAGTEIVVLYERYISADVLENKSDVFTSKCIMYVDAMCEDKCGNLYRVQFYFPKVEFNGEFSFEMGDNQTVHNFEAEALSGACGAASTLWTYTVYGANAEDVAA